MGGRMTKKEKKIILKISKIRTIRNVRLLLTGTYGDRIRTARDSEAKHRFRDLANKIAEQLHIDTKDEYKNPKKFVFPPDEITLSRKAKEMLQNLERIKKEMRV